MPETIISVVTSVAPLRSESDMIPRGAYASAFVDQATRTGWSCA